MGKHHVKHSDPDFDLEYRPWCYQTTLPVPGFHDTDVGKLCGSDAAIPD